MLILSRKIGESLVINDEIKIKIVDISGSYVKLGIEAPKDLAVLREELIDANKSNLEK